MACVIGKNLISNRSGDSRYAELWNSFEDQFKQSMKEAILAQLVCPSQVVRTQIASFVSTVAAIEIPQGKWLDLIENLCNNAGNQNAQVKHTSLQTLGFICEELETEHLQVNHKNQIIHALTSSIDKNEGNDFPFTTVATKALLKAIFFADQNFLVEHERNFIMGKIFEALEIRANVQVREAALQTLVELAHLQYDCIELYLPQIAQITAQVVNNDDSSVGLQGIEFWTTLTEKETAREKRSDPQAPSKNYIRSNADALITLVL